MNIKANEVYKSKKYKFEKYVCSIEVQLSILINLQRQQNLSRN